MDTCKGDSGGPIVANINGQFTLVGITSFGLKDGCGSKVAGYYADVSYSDNFKFINSVKSTGVEHDLEISGISKALREFLKLLND